jgi:hypothetical protein
MNIFLIAESTADLVGVWAKKSPNVNTLGLNKYGTYLLSQAAA